MDSPTVIYWSKIVGSSLVATVIVFKVWRKITSSRPKKDYPADTVILHQLGRGPYAPSLTPFAVKLETYLRMTKIPYINDHSMVASKKSKFPWITYNKDDIADSQFCIEYLNKVHGINHNKGFSPKELAVARAFQKMLEENSYWALVLDRWVYDKDMKVLSFFKVSRLLRYMVSRNCKKMAHGQGMGRHSVDEVYHILDLDLKALSDFLGSKKFLLGDSPCVEDCSIFGILTQLYWQSFGNRAEQTFKRYTNLCDYCDRMKETFWPDWEECITKGGTVKATK